MFQSATRSLSRSVLRPVASSSRVAVRHPTFAGPSASTSFSFAAAPRSHYSTEPTSSDPASKEGDAAATASSGSDKAAPAADDKSAEWTKQLEDKNKQIAELKDARLRSLADYENLQKISAREKVQAKDFALQSFAKDLISSIDILVLALKSIPPTKLEPSANPPKDLVDLYQGVSLTKDSILKTLARNGIVAFDPVGEQFDPNKHEALYQAPVPGKEPGSVLECQEIGYMIKDRLLRPAKVGVVAGDSS